MLKTKVYVQNINNLSDARYCAGMGVDYMSFDHEKLNIEEIMDIFNWIEGVQLVVPIDFEGINNEDVYRLNENTIVDSNGQPIHELIQSKDNPTNSSLLFTEDMDTASILAQIEKENIDGIVIFGGDEIRPGYKDFDEIADILEALEID